MTVRDQEKGRVMMIKEEKLAFGGRAKKPAQTWKGHRVESDQQEDQTPAPPNPPTEV